MKSHALIYLAFAFVLVACVPLPPLPESTSLPSQPQPPALQTPTAPPPTSMPESPTPLPTVAPAATSTAAVVARATVPAAARDAASPTPALAPFESLDQAVAALRDVDLESMPEAQQQAKAQEMDSALLYIESTGQAGADRLKDELASLKEADKPDVFFELLAGWVLLDIRGLDEADTVIGIWRELSPEQLSQYYNLVFNPVMQVASTHDLRALPMLELVLANSQDDTHGAMHAWGIFGPKGLPRLHEILKTSTESTSAEFAISQLGQTQYLPALPDIRAALTREETPVRQAAIVALGRLGHPDDYATLLKGLASTDPAELSLYISALGIFGDTRAVPQLAPLLQHKDAAVRMRVMSALGNYLVTPEALRALHDYAAQVTDGDEQSRAAGYVTDALEISGLTWDAFVASTPAEQDRIAADARNANYTLMEGERALTRAEFLDMVALWTELGRKYIIDASEGNLDYNDVELRHILPAATAGDIDLLLEARATFYARFSDESDYDISDVNAIVRELGRTRYRAPVTPPTPQAPASPAERSVVLVSQDRAQQLMEAAVNAVEGVSSAMLMPDFLNEGSGTLSYTTSLSADGLPDPFMEQLRQVVFAAVPGFVRASPPWETLEFSPRASGGYGTVTIARQPALDWYTGKLDDAAFEKTWKIDGFVQ